MTIKQLQSHVGALPDGFWGPKSISACQAHLTSLMPEPGQWPRGNDDAMRKYYGQPGESGLVNLDVAGLGIQYQGKPIKIIRCNERVAPSLRRVLADIAGGPHAWILSHYAGCFNHRSMRGGSSLSKHAWGVAIDLDPEQNGNRTHWPIAATMPIGVMEAFARENWIAAGAFWGRDAMHFQAAW